MPNYQHGKIYQIYSVSNPNLRYIGATTQALSSRKASHKYHYRCWKVGKHYFLTVFKVFGGCDDYRMELIENCPSDNKEKLRAREGFYIRTMKCVNKQVVGRSQAEWVNTNKEKLKDYRKKWYQENKERIKINNEKNKEKIKIRKQKYYERQKLKKIANSIETKCSS